MSSRKPYKDMPGLVVVTEDKDEILILSPEDTSTVLRMLQVNASEEPVWLSDSRVLLCDTAAYGMRDDPRTESLRSQLLEPRRHVGLLVSPSVYQRLLDIAIECDEPAWKVSARQNTDGGVDFTIISNDASRFIRAGIRRVLEVL